MVSDQLVYITGSGHSGSTLLDMLLGGHTSITTLGEAHRLYISANKSALPHYCACGEHVLTCSFWREVQRQLTQDVRSKEGDLLKRTVTTDPAALKTIGDEVLWEPAIPPKYAVNLNKIAMLVGSSKLWKALSYASGQVRLHRKIAQNSSAVYEAVRKVAGTPIIVDATKNANRLKGLYLSAPEKMKVIYLARDGRAVTRSRMKRHPVSMEEAASVWKAEHLKIYSALFTVPKEKIFVCQYEGICRDPVASLEQICSFLKISFQESMLKFRENHFHRLGGNPMRFRSSERKIKLDEAWRSELSKEQLGIFDRVAGKLNERLGYRRF